MKHLEVELSSEKIKLIRKYKLVSKQIGKKIFWVKEFRNRPDHPYATHRAFKRCHIIELVFSIYDLCVAKMTYFRKHLANYTPCKLNYRTQAMEPCELWDMEFLVQKRTHISIDLRNLASISEIEVFHAMCQWLEAHLEHHTSKQRIHVISENVIEGVKTTLSYEKFKTAKPA